ncbi:hypothetical protein CI610_02120 [invertebrate metagenome]|uniref:Uncharacterized protein n=1 Tax=invertebrate metagenome TaxID=1711999 RepID=A0A2H9T6U5_9ZZZZ
MAMVITQANHKYDQSAGHVTIQLLTPALQCPDTQNSQVTRLKRLSGNETGVSVHTNGCELSINLDTYRFLNDGAQETLTYSYRINYLQGHYTEHTAIIVIIGTTDTPCISEAVLREDSDDPEKESVIINLLTNIPDISSDNNEEPHAPDDPNETLNSDVTQSLSEAINEEPIVLSSSIPENNSSQELLNNRMEQEPEQEKIVSAEDDLMELVGAIEKLDDPTPTINTEQHQKTSSVYHKPDTFTPETARVNNIEADKETSDRSGSPTPEVIQPVTGSVTVDVSACTDKELVASGSLILANQVMNDTTINAGNFYGMFGSLIIDGTGNWTYTADIAQPALTPCETGENLRECISLTCQDNSQYTLELTFSQRAHPLSISHGRIHQQK